MWPPSNGSSGHQVDRAEHEVQLGQEEPEGQVEPALDGVAADDRCADDADRRLRVALAAADRVHQRTDLGRDLRQRLAQFDGQVAGERHRARDRGHAGCTACTRRPELGGRDADRADGRRGRCGVGREALGLHDVDDRGDLLSVALDDERGRAAGGADGGDHLVGIVHVGVADLDDDVALLACLRRPPGPSPVQSANLSLLICGCDTGGLADIGRGLRLRFGRPQCSAMP